MNKQDEELLQLMSERRAWFTPKEDGSFVTDFSNPELAAHIINKMKAFAVQEFANEACGDCTTEFQRKLSDVANQYANKIVLGE